jgi:prophage tail gpP-like protein
LTLVVGSVFEAFVEPRNPVRVQADGTPVFTGLIDDWSFSYSPGGDSVASFQASDAFALFARNLE